MKSNHTQGPWTFEYNGEQGSIMTKDPDACTNGRDIAQVEGFDALDNSRLIAAAPVQHARHETILARIKNLDLNSASRDQILQLIEFIQIDSQLAINAVIDSK